MKSGGEDEPAGDINERSSEVQNGDSTGQHVTDEETDRLDDGQVADSQRTGRPPGNGGLSLRSTSDKLAPESSKDLGRASKEAASKPHLVTQMVKLNDQWSLTIKGTQFNSFRVISYPIEPQNLISCSLLSSRKRSRFVANIVLKDSLPPWKTLSNIFSFIMVFRLRNFAVKLLVSFCDSLSYDSLSCF